MLEELEIFAGWLVHLLGGVSWREHIEEVCNLELEVEELKLWIERLRG